MMDEFLEFDNTFTEDMGILSRGRVKLSRSSIIFKNEQTGKVITVPTSELHGVEWLRLANQPGIRLVFEAPDEDSRAQQRVNMRIGGFKDDDQERIATFIEDNWNRRLKEKELALKGWNYGDATVKGPNLEFSVDQKLAFEVPLHNVSNCLAAKNEATLEFHQNEDAPVGLMEMRFFMAELDTGEDRVELFKQKVLKYAGIEADSGQPVATLEQIQCITPRGHYDIKVYPNHLSLHGKSYDYKIPVKSITRLFLVPHRDGRRMYFVGRTRYHYLVLVFERDEHVDLELGMPEEQLEELYKEKLEKEVSGALYEVVSKIFRVITDMRITVPGHFIGHSGAPTVNCAHKKASGTMYPLEKGFLYIHNPTMYIRFEEMASIHFARSDVSTRTFDLEIELKTGDAIVLSSVEKEEYDKLFDFLHDKGVRIRNARRMATNYKEDRFARSDDELDAYDETMKAEGKEKMEGDEDSDEEDSDYDLDKDLETRRKTREEDSSEGSQSEPDEEWDSDVYGSGSESGGVTGTDGEEDEETPKKKKKMV